jgi:hypothetical protein
VIDVNDAAIIATSLIRFMKFLWSDLNYFFVRQEQERCTT